MFLLKMNLFNLILTQTAFQDIAYMKEYEDYEMYKIMNEMFEWNQ